MRCEMHSRRGDQRVSASQTDSWRQRNKRMIGYTLATACVVVGWAIAYTAHRDGQPRWIVVGGFLGGPAVGACMMRYIA